MNKKNIIYCFILFGLIGCHRSKHPIEISFTLVNSRDTLYYKKTDISGNPRIIEEYYKKNGLAYVDRLVIYKNQSIYRKIGFPGYIFIPEIRLPLKISESFWIPIKGLKKGVVSLAIHDREYSGGIYTERDSIFRNVVDIDWKVEISMVEKKYSKIISDTSIIFQYRMRPPCANTPSFEEKEYDLYGQLIRYKYYNGLYGDTLEFLIGEKDYLRYYPIEKRGDKIFN